MPEVSVTVNGRSYALACSPGEEERLTALAVGVDDMVRTLADTHGPIGETRLLLVACLLLADQLDDALGEIETLKGGTATAAGTDDELTTDLDALAQRIEDIAARLKPT